MIVARSITVSWTQDGFHRWPDASGDRRYLADRHRHRFGFAVTVPVDDPDRAVEFHDLLDSSRALLTADSEPKEFGARSCESIGEALAVAVGVRWNVPWCEVAVNEDGYATGTVRWEQQA